MVQKLKYLPLSVSQLFLVGHLLYLKLLIEFNIPIFTLILIQKEESSAVGKSIKLLITINMMKVEKFYITIIL